MFALLGGGGYAELAVAHAGHVMRIPPNLSFEQAACICETYLTAFMNLFLYARLADGETVLLHGGGGGVTTAAMQIVKALAPRARLLVTASTGKVERVESARRRRRHRLQEGRFRRSRAAPHGKTRRRRHPRPLGRLVPRAERALARRRRAAGRDRRHGRAQGELDVGRVSVNRLSILGSVLRPRPVEEKTAIIHAFERDVMPYFAAGRIAPLIHRVYPLEQAAEAHRAMEAGEHFGKLVLRVRRYERCMTILRSPLFVPGNKATCSRRRSA